MGLGTSAMPLDDDAGWQPLASPSSPGRPPSVDLSTRPRTRWSSGESLASAYMAGAGDDMAQSPLRASAPRSFHGHDMEHNDTSAQGSAGRTAWQSFSSLPLDDLDGESKHSASVLGDALDTYLLDRDDLGHESDQDRLVDPEGPRDWTEYLPTGGIDEYDHNDEPLEDEESRETSPQSRRTPRSHIALSEMLHGIAKSGRHAVERANRKIKRTNRTMPWNQDSPQAGQWLPMEDTDQVETRTSAPDVRPVHARLRGKTLMLFGPTNPVRVWCARLLETWWIEPLILAVITTNLVILIVSSSRDIVKHSGDYDLLTLADQILLLVVFFLYTLETAARIIVSGLLIDPPPYDEALQQNASSESLPSKEAQEDVCPSHMKSNTVPLLIESWHWVKAQMKRIIYPRQAALRARSMTRLTGILSPDESDKLPLPPPGHVPDVPWNAPTSYEKKGLMHKVWRLFLTVCLRFSRGITGDIRVLSERAYLRSSWNRVDFLAVLCYWIALILDLAGADRNPHRHIYLFRAVSVLRCARLMALPSGVSMILLSLKRVAPLLMRVAYFIGFFMVLFAIIGIQSFKGSYRRQCVWIGDLNNEPGVNVTLDQLCGGSYNPQNSSEQIGHVPYNVVHPNENAKGYICPYGQLCMEQPSNPNNNVQSFDNVFTSLLEVAVVISLNGWSDIMYDMIDADYYTACIFFIFGIILLNFWLANLFVAVITHSFASLSAQTEHSAFAASVTRPEPSAPTSDPQRTRKVRRRAVEVYKRVWGYTKYLWLALILLSISIQGSQSSYQTHDAKLWRSRAERYITVAFDVEILLRFLTYALDGNPRIFLHKKHNALDLFLAVITTVIQIPKVHTSRWYSWLTFFQLARFYRVIAAVPRMRVLLARVLGSMDSLFNMIAFLIMIIFLAALFSVQLFRGDIPGENEDGEEQEMTWKQLFNGFLGVYQVFSSEDWTSTMMNVLSSERNFHQAVISGIFLVGWFIFANFIVLQMFIAVINENFRVAEGDKYKRQMEQYLKRSEPRRMSRLERLMQKFSPFREQRTSEPSLPVTNDAQRIVPLNTIAGPSANSDTEKKPQSLFMQLVTPDRAGQAVDTLQRVLRLDKPREHARLKAFQTRYRDDGPGQGDQRRTLYDFEHVYYDEDEQARLVAGRQTLRDLRTDLGLNDPEARHEEFMNEYVQRSENDPRIQMARTIAEHPSYDRSWYLFSNRNPIRRFCQSLTPCSHGERVFGRPMSRIRNYIFQSTIFAAIVGSVVVAAIATPQYRKRYYADNGWVFASWFSVIELSLSVFFVLEFFVKTIADGLAFTPNAYVLSVWNLLDMFVLISLLINVISELATLGGVSNFTRALKAFRALRLINLSSLMRDTFHAVMIAGAGRILDASLLALLYIIPYAVWGQNLFAGLLYSCNDDGKSILTKLDCHGEFQSSPLTWSFLAPRVWSNPTQGSSYSFDDFKSALLILFEIVSLEGWIDVMTQSMKIVGRDKQPKTDAAQHNALFFLIYNLIGAVSVLTLFVSVIIENFQRYSGAAYLTTEQRQWLDLKRQLRRQTASKRPKQVPKNDFVKWCFRAATQKQGWWLRSMTAMHLGILVVLMTQQYSDPPWAERVRSIIYTFLALVYMTDIVVRLIGLGFSGFRRNLWNWYDVLVMAGVMATSIPLAINMKGSQVHSQLQKIFLTGVALKLVQRNDALNQLFKTAIGSVPAIVSLFLLWLTMFFVWGIMLVEVFGLTKWGANETHAKNFSSLWGTLVFLLMTSTGEGWNTYMHDYTVQSPLCTPSNNYLESDCGSMAWSYFLFITWNIISMFIFLNMFTGTVVENFSYVYHLQGSTALSREQMRLYKDAWSKYDSEGLGYIQRDQIVPFLTQLMGMFEVGLYPPEARIPVLMERAQAQTPASTAPSSPSSAPRLRLGLHLPRSPRRSPRSRSPVSPHGSENRSPVFLGENLQRVSAASSPMRRSSDVGSHSSGGGDGGSSSGGRVESGINIDRLNAILSTLDPDELRMRRIRLNRMYQEALLSDKGKGVSFTSMLFILAYHKMCSKPTNMEVSEFIERRALLDRIDSTISLERVRGLLRTVYLRRRFLAARANHEHITRIAMQNDDRGYPLITVEGDVGRAPQRPRISLDTNVEPHGTMQGEVPDVPPVPDALRTPTVSYSDYFGGDIADGASPDGTSEVRLSPLSLSPMARRRLSFNEHGPNPFADPERGRSEEPPGSSSSIQTHRTPSPSREMGAWNSVLRRLSPERHDGLA